MLTSTQRGRGSLCRLTMAGQWLEVGTVYNVVMVTTLDVDQYPAWAGQFVPSDYGRTMVRGRYSVQWSEVGTMWWWLPLWMLTSTQRGRGSLCLLTMAGQWSEVRSCKAFISSETSILCGCHSGRFHFCKCSTTLIYLRYYFLSYCK